MASFTGVGDNTTLNPKARGEQVAIALSGTYNMTILFQREVGSPGSGAWETIYSYSTANATVAATYVTAGENERLRLFVSVDTSGTCVATLTEGTNTALTVRDGNGNVALTADDTGMVSIYNAAGAIVRKLGAGPVAVTDATTYAVLVADSGRLHVLPDFTATCTLSLPAAAAGLEYEFMYGGAAADAQNAVISTGADTNYFVGGVVHLDANAGSAGDEVVPLASDGNSNSKLTLVTPGLGTWVKVVCNGTTWALVGYVVSDTVPTLGDQ